MTLKKVPNHVLESWCHPLTLDMSLQNQVLMQTLLLMWVWILCWVWRGVANREAKLSSVCCKYLHSPLSPLQ